MEIQTIICLFVFGLAMGIVLVEQYRKAHDRAGRIALVLVGVLLFSIFVLIGNGWNYVAASAGIGILLKLARR